MGVLRESTEEDIVLNVRKFTTVQSRRNFDFGLLASLVNLHV